MRNADVAAARLQGAQKKRCVKEARAESVGEPKQRRGASPQIVGGAALLRRRIVGGAAPGGRGYFLVDWTKW